MTLSYGYVAVVCVLSNYRHNTSISNEVLVQLYLQYFSFQETAFTTRLDVHNGGRYSCYTIFKAKQILRCIVYV